MKAASSYLFVPGERAERFDKALASGADRVILDLEDAVLPEAKARARDTVHDWLERHGADARVLVRVNGVDTPWHEDDLSIAVLPGVAGIMLPKAERASDLVRVRASLRDSQALYALIETVDAVVRLREIAAVAGLTRLAFGSFDFCSDAGIGDDRAPLDPVRTQLVIESRHARLPAPVDGVTLALGDEAALAADVSHARSFGMGAKLCIHPRQVETVKRGFLPSEAESAWARRVLDAIAQGSAGAIAVDGKLVDRPVVERAKAIVAQLG
ncbi:HpcH/HpaI aldolase/citrate lyase family protein [Paraburkholderia susongensis]|uniref:Citrate lyase subunit beta / citryl-CoA lyase n=1 Tax=Paraburkholderia susongensis TaxID=1515439 RepID=A0A1X7M084_9BURK|nr:CoA ester lyase [Paraburkholderia susongensis]SMG58922.1 citrate lyase subunit beta / citryl-CoA lyase [Paraburkholderia susongensis]